MSITILCGWRPNRPQDALVLSECSTHEPTTWQYFKKKEGLRPDTLFLSVTGGKPPVLLICNSKPILYSDFRPFVEKKKGLWETYYYIAILVYLVVSSCKLTHWHLDTAHACETRLSDQADTPREWDTAGTVLVAIVGRYVTVYLYLYLESYVYTPLLDSNVVSRCDCTQARAHLAFLCPASFHPRGVWPKLTRADAIRVTLDTLGHSPSSPRLSSYLVSVIRCGRPH